MPVQGPLDHLPLWGVFVATVVLILLAVEAGYLLGEHRRRSEKGEAGPGPVGEVVAGMLGLLAFMLAFTFGLAASRFDNRRILVIKEANAIGTTWLRAGLLQEPSRTEVCKLLREYLELRLATVQSGKVEEALAASEELHRRVWAQAVAVGEKNPSSIVVGLFISSLNEVIDLHTERVVLAWRNRIPVSIWGALYFVAVLAIGAMGYHAGVAGARRFFVIIPLVLTFSVVLLLIVDLDRPQEGMLRVSQQALADLRTMMNERKP